MLSELAQHSVLTATVTSTADKKAKAENIIRSPCDYHTEVSMPASLTLKLTTQQPKCFMFYHIMETVSPTVEASDKFCLSSKDYFTVNKPQKLIKFQIVFIKKL